MASVSCEQHTVLQALDAIVAEDPGRLYCIQPVSSDISEGWREISFADLEGAINHTALWIQEKVLSSNKPEILAYMGANDIRYAAFVFACMRLRLTVGILDVRCQTENLTG